MPFVTRENFWRNVSVAWPLALNSILVQSMSLIDVLLVAPLGEIPIAALGISTAIIVFITGIQYALASGTQLLIARYFGAEDARKVSTALLAGWLINGFFSVLVFVGLYFSMHWVLGFVVREETVIVEAVRYLNIVLLMLVPSSISQVMIAFYNGCRKTRIPLYGYFLEIPINVGLSVVLIYGYFGLPELGLAGAAIGSFSAIVIRMLYLGWCLSRETFLPLFKELRSLSVGVIRAHFKEVSPIAANYLILSTGVLLHQLLYAQLDINSYAAITLVMPWMQMGTQFVTAWSHATAINVSQFLGKKEEWRIPEFITHAIKIVLVLAVFLSFGFTILSLLLPHLYPQINEQTRLALATIAPVYILLPLARTYNGLCGNTLRALGESFKVLKIHFVTQWVIGIPVLAFLVFFGAPLMLVFGVIFLEECLKVYYFRERINDKKIALRKLSETGLDS